jgi:long-chain acyl-CoA synthetase
MSIYDEKVWLSQYHAAQREPRTIEFDNALAMFDATVERNPDADIIRYFDGRITARELDELSDAFAAGIIDAGFRPGERVVIYAQNIPQFVIAQLGTWKAGGTAVSANPMYRERELEEILRDSGATILVALQSLYTDVAAKIIGSTDVRTVITTSELEFQSVNSGTLAGVERSSVPAPRIWQRCSRPSAVGPSLLPR